FKVPNSEEGTRRALTLKDILNGTFSYKTYFPNWISGQEYLHQSSDNNIVLYNIETGESYVLLSNITMKNVNASNYGLSPDRQFVYLESDYSKLWRYSYTATYHIYDLRKREFIIGYALPRPIQYLCWSPVGSKLAYVYQYNIYLKQRPGDLPFQITYNGRENKIFNGIPDWVYEEEMLATKYAIWWSPNGKFLAYAEFNDSDIPVIAYSYYGDEQYPRTINIPYPKAGAKNPTVRIFIIDTTYPQHVGPIEVPVPAMIASSDYYFSWLTWVTDERICLQWLKRVQNVSVMSICDFREDWHTWDCPKAQEHIEESRTGWAGGFFVSTPVFSYDAISYYKIFSDKDGYKHIHYIKDTVENAIQITSGKWEAINIFRVTQDSLLPIIATSYRGITVYGYWKVEMIVPNLEKGKLIFRPLIKLAKALLVAKKDSEAQSSASRREGRAEHAVCQTWCQHEKPRSLHSASNLEPDHPPCSNPRSPSQKPPSQEP
uniref:Prolyl endopeptidase FAP-like n=1 Tax=Castor canadensis TaxID=51338 RepID=A0A8B7TT09_CASCN